MGLHIFKQFDVKLVQEVIGGLKVKGDAEEMQTLGSITHRAGVIGSVWAYQTKRLGAGLLELSPDSKERQCLPCC